ncbi:hypothetical protein AW736_26385 [Termitidicoccus mucosus]|uniref:Uncharacterized protein n=1 Tax=Termitidicoccus mucosus TaxID=1184151 RepID=A0A178IQ84_9BACT|nr:hypothetical protein AW736_26385 [Opitutaceae bacterium TSB47]
MVEQFKTPIGLLPLGDQDFTSDPVWQMANYTAVDYFPMRTELMQVMESLIHITVELPDIRIPVGQFYGSCGGKSGPRRSLHDFAYHVLREDGAIGFQTEAHWQENIRSFETRFNSHAPIAGLFNWSRRLYLWNADQSHHFAALYRQSRDQHRKWQAPCNLKVYDWNQSIEEIPGMIRFIARNRMDSVWHHVNQCSAKVEHVQIGRSELGLHAIQLSNLDSEVMDMALNAILQLEGRGLIIRLSQMRNRLRFSEIHSMSSTSRAASVMIHNL